ncbi:MAG: putative porin [Pseudomonadales bacterium]|nr:putative porin [Pseudomonadales bacterium]
MTIKTFLIVISMTLPISTALADTYQLDAQISYQESIDREGRTDFESSQIATSITWWISPVADHKGPWAEAGFLSKEDSFQLSYAQNEIDFSVPGLVRGSDTDAETFNLKYRYVHEGTGFYGMAGLGQSITNQTNVIFDEVKSDLYEIRLGYYVTDHTSIELFDNRSEADERERGVVNCLLSRCVQTFDTTFSTEVESFGILAKHVGQIGNQHYTIVAQYGRQETETRNRTILTYEPARFAPPTLRFDSNEDFRNEFFGTTLVWYPNFRLGVGVGFESREVEGPRSVFDLDRYKLSFDWFINHRYRIQIHYIREDDISVLGIKDLDSSALSIHARF